MCVCVIYMDETIYSKQIIQEKEGLKLTRNSKGYNWEIKLTEINIERIDKINEDMKARFEGE